jgi:glycolate oxidase FAD binding subunit
MTDRSPDLGAVIGSVPQSVAPSALDVAETVAPRSTGEASQVLDRAANERLTVGFAGSGSCLGLGGAGTYDLGLVSSGMSDIIDWQPEDLTIVVGAGLTVGELEAHLTGRRQTSLLPRTNPARTVGGVIAEGASSYSRLKYGPTRDRVLEVTMATGYGERVRGGARVVKNVTGYDLPRLVTGSMGSLGFIGTVCLKLWPTPPVSQVVRVDDAAKTLMSVFRPVAVLETDDGSFVRLEGTEGDVGTQTAAIGGEIVDAAASPPPIDLDVMASVRVPPRSLAATVDAVRRSAATRWIAQHGVGIIEAGWPELGPEPFGELRRSIQQLDGVTVLRRSGPGLGGVDPWGASPDAVTIQRRMKSLFDPASVCNPGKLPGGT